MRLYIANCTKQFQEVHYRLDFNASGSPEPNARFQPAKRQTIAPGRQVALGGDLDHLSQIDDIMDQLRRYGLVAQMDVERTKRIIPLVCNVDTPVKAETIRRVINMNSGIQIEQGRDRRTKGAIIANDTVTRVVDQELATNGIDKAADSSVELEFEQLEQSSAGERRIEEGYRLDHRAPPPSKNAKGGKGRRR